MMNRNIPKYLFYISAILLLVVMIMASRSAGISCDDILHYDHSVQVCNYFSSHGSDKSALDTPVSNLKYYGQSYDNIVTILIRFFNINDVYTFRHLMSSIAGWLGILITALFAVWLMNYRAGLIVILLFAVSPAFFGHSLNNLKDIPFATFYIGGVFFITRFLVSDRRSVTDMFLLLLSIAFCISIRAGGLLLICYLFFFYGCYHLYRFLKERKINRKELVSGLLIIMVISMAAYFLSMLLWPYALQDPFRNVLESYRVMAHYPATFREIFEGKVQWSDLMPWYYLIKYMGITIPLAVFTGLVLFIVFAGKIFEKNILSWLILLFTVLFPVFFVLILKSNLYSSWRQFLFVYPGIVLLSAAGINYFFESVRNKYIRVASLFVILFLFLNPLNYMIRNHPYEYIYYNELAGGVKGAYGNYELDYYYSSNSEASEWLLKYLDENNIRDDIKVAATYSVEWQFRDHPEIETSWFRYEERSQSDWDYAIAGNRYITPFKLKNGLWPPENAIHVIYADGIPICAVLERQTRDDLYGYTALKKGEYRDAVDYFKRATSVDDDDEMIFYNFAGALYGNGQHHEADSVLKLALRLNPDFEPALMYLGNIAKTKNNFDEAVLYYKKVIDINPKYFEAYLSLAELTGQDDVFEARKILRDCLRINPGYTRAIIALGDTYRETDPEIANKYYEQARNKK